MQKFIAVILILVFLLSGCSFALSPVREPTVIPISDLLLNANSTYSSTPTPFQPIAPTPTITSTPAPVFTEIPTQVEQSNDYTTIDLGLQKPPGQVNILLLGSDWRGNRSFRTDVILLLSLNPQQGTISLLSFPRDLYVEIPGVGMERINAAQEYGGFVLTAATFESNFGIQIDYYLLTSFSGFKNIVDTLGGVNVYSASYLSDTCDLPQAIDKMCSVSAGSNFMDGQTALWYVRSRHSSSDFDRTRRAQEVILAIFQKSMSLDALSRGAELYDLFISSVDTNLPVGKVLELLPLASKALNNSSIIRRYAIGANQVYNYIVPGSGAMVLIPDPTLVGETIRQALFQ
jgi:LCP family protein required for cell wall assembly